MTPDRETAQKNLDAALGSYMAGREYLHATILAADHAGVGRNEIARSVATVYSRATVFKLLGALSVREQAEQALGRDLDTRVVFTQASAGVLLLELTLFTEGAWKTRLNLATDVLRALEAGGVTATAEEAAPDLRTYLATGRNRVILSVE